MKQKKKDTIPKTKTKPHFIINFRKRQSCGKSNIYISNYFYQSLYTNIYLYIYVCMSMSIIYYSNVYITADVKQVASSHAHTPRPLVGLEFIVGRLVRGLLAREAGYVLRHRGTLPHEGVQSPQQVPLILWVSLNWQQTLPLILPLFPLL